MPGVPPSRAVPCAPSCHTRPVRAPQVPAAGRRRGADGRGGGAAGAAHHIHHQARRRLPGGPRQCARLGVRAGGGRGGHARANTSACLTHSCSHAPSQGRSMVGVNSSVALTLRSGTPRGPGPVPSPDTPHPALNPPPSGKRHTAGAGGRRRPPRRGRARAPAARRRGGGAALRLGPPAGGGPQV